jgi:BirA family biotin operon repressor/biotin-[acetyl-CoA-carboxylase] ligase
VQSAEGGALIAGIGVNVNQANFPEELAAIATSLKIETGKDHDKETLLNRVIAESLRYAALPQAEILNQFEEHSTYVKGKTVTVDGRIKGVTAGLDANGFLLLQTDAGLQTILTGGLRAYK